MGVGDWFSTFCVSLRMDSAKRSSLAYRTGRITKAVNLSFRSLDSDSAYRFYVGSLNRTLAVGGCTPAFTPWVGSSFGPEVDICAPAWPVRRASVDRKGKPTYARGDGTSFASPLVAGTAALWLRHHGEAIRSTYRKKWQWVEAFKRVLTSTAQPGVDWDRRRYGAGILDAQAALKAELPHPDSLDEDGPA